MNTKLNQLNQLNLIMNKKLNYGEHFSYEGRLYKANFKYSVSIDHLDGQEESIETPDIDDVIILSGKVAVLDGYQYFNRKGYLNRDDGPAIDMPDHKEWYRNGYPHRINGPARINNNVGTDWYVDGELHRIDGPARIRSNGDTEYWVNGEPHRIDGPAIVHADGKVEYWVKGNQVSEYEVMFMNPAV